MRNKKISRKPLLALLALLALSNQLFSQELTVQAPKQVYVGDNFNVTFVVNAQARDFKGPTFKGFSLRSGPHEGFQQSTSIINGQWSNSVQTTFSYRLLADVEGSFTIGAATCTVDGKKISSPSFTIKVEKMSQAQMQQRQQQQQARQQRRQAYDPWAQQPQPASKIDANTLFARAVVSNAHPWQGEQIIVTYKIYTQVPLSQAGIDKLPGNKGFWSEDLSAGKQIKQYEETYNGQRYQVAEIRKGALFAQQSGRLSIEPLDLNVLAMVQRQRRRTGTLLDLFDDPFFNMSQAVEYPLHTKALAVNVKPLPPGPDNFSGAVGTFSVKGGLNLDKVKSNEAVSFRLTVSGRGNLMLITPSTPDFPSSPWPPSFGERNTRPTSSTLPAAAKNAPPAGPAAASRKPPLSSAPASPMPSMRRFTKPSGAVSPTNTPFPSRNSTATASMPASSRNRYPLPSRSAS